MGILDPIRLWWKRASLEAKKLELEEAAIELQTNRLREYSTLADTSIPQGWNILNGGVTDSGDVKISETEYYELIKNSKELDIKNQSYHACLETFRKFVYGKGPKVQAKLAEITPGKEPTAAEKALAQEQDEYWQAFCIANDMKRKWKEINKRKNRDGDCFMSFEGSDKTTAFKTVNVNGTEYKVPVFRFLAAERVKDAAGMVPLGVEVDKDDPETVISYRYLNNTGTESRTISSEHVIHWKCNSDSDWRRGLPKLTSVMHWFRELNRFAQNAVDRTSIQNAHVLIRKVSNNQGASSVRSQNLKTNTSDDEYIQKRVHGGTVITTGPGIDYQFIGPQMEGARPEDARLIQLLCAAGAGLAEYMVSADASNANYASTMISESPAVRTFEDEQDEDEFYIGKLWRKVMDFGVVAGELSSNAYTECVVHWCPLIHRNMKEEAEALAILEGFGLSHETILNKTGYNARDEFARSRSELELRAELSPDVQGDSEEDDARSTLQREMAEAVRHAEHECCTAGDHEASECLCKKN